MRSPIRANMAANPPVRQALRPQAMPSGALRRGRQVMHMYIAALMEDDARAEKALPPRMHPGSRPADRS